MPLGRFEHERSQHYQLYVPFHLDGERLLDFGCFVEGDHLGAGGLMSGYDRFAASPWLQEPPRSPLSVACFHLNQPSIIDE